MSKLAAVEFNHIALSVPNAQAAVDWYTSLFGLEVLVPIETKLMAQVYGEDLRATKLAVLQFGNGIALEIFEFISPPYNGPQERVDWSAATYTSGGQFHFCLTVADVNSVVEQAVSAGGKQVGEYISTVPGHTAAYVQDPWGNVIELANMTLKDLFMQVRRSA